MHPGENCEDFLMLKGTTANQLYLQPLKDICREKETGNMKLAGENNYGLVGLIHGCSLFLIKNNKMVMKVKQENMTVPEDWS